MDVKITRENEILVTAAVEVPWDRVAPHQKKALQEIGGMAQVPGFRKGKAPVALLKKRFKDEITQEVIRNLIPDCLREVVEGNHLKAVAPPRLKEANIHDKEHLHFVAEIDIKPEIELLNWKGLEAEAIRVKVTEEAKTFELERLLEAARKTEPVTDRPAEAGDTVTLSLTALHENETLSDLDSYQLTLGADGAHKNLSELVLGANLEDDLHDEFEADDDDSFEAWRGKTIKVFLEIKEIKRVVEVNLDDAFAVQQGVENLEALRSQVEERILKSAELGEEGRLNNVLMTLAMQDYKFDLPKVWVDTEARGMAEQQMGQYMQMMGDQDARKKEQMMESMLEYTIPQATAKLRADVVLDRLAVEVGAEATDEELNQELETYLPYSEAKSLEELKEQITKNGNLDNIVDVIKRRKALEALREAAVLTEVDELTENKTEDMDEYSDPENNESIPNEEVIIEATEVAEVVSEEDPEN